MKDFHLSAKPLTGSAAQWIAAGMTVGMYTRERVCDVCVEKQQPPDYREVINICMTGQRTAYFHVNILVSSEVSAGDAEKLCNHVYWYIENTSGWREKIG